MADRPSLILALLLTACPPVAPEDPPRPPPPDAAAPEACPAACVKFRELGCPEGEPTPGGESCEAVCRNAEESGIITLNPSCVPAAKTCDEARRCTR